ncbi:hypothetical protein [Streptomyces sp. NPDC002758]
MLSLTLRPGGRELTKRLHGVVTRLNRDVAPPEATVYGSFLHEDSVRGRKVRVELRPKDIDRAADAWRRGLEVVVEGDLEPRGRVCGCAGSRCSRFGRSSGSAIRPGSRRARRLPSVFRTPGNGVVYDSGFGWSGT